MDEYLLFRESIVGGRLWMDDFAPDGGGFLQQIQDFREGFGRERGRIGICIEFFALQLDVDIEVARELADYLLHGRPAEHDFTFPPGGFGQEAGFLRLHRAFAFGIN